MKKLKIYLSLVLAIPMAQAVGPAFAGSPYEPIGVPLIPVFEKILAAGGVLVGRTGASECRFEVRKFLWSGAPTYRWEISYEYDAVNHWHRSVNGGFDFASQLKERSARRIRLQGMAGYPGRHTSLYIDLDHSGTHAGEIRRIRAVGYGISELLFPVETIEAEFESPRESQFRKLHERTL